MIIMHLIHWFVRQVAAAECVFSNTASPYFHSTTQYTRIQAAGNRTIKINAPSDGDGNHEPDTVTIQENAFDKFCKLKTKGGDITCKSSGSLIPIFSLSFDKYNSMLVDKKNTTQLGLESRVPVYSNSWRASWPLTEKFAENALLLHNPAIKSYADVKGAYPDYVSALTDFLQTPQCPEGLISSIYRASLAAHYSKSKTHRTRAHGNRVVQEGAAPSKHC